MDRWRGRTALVTGAASGIGRSVARRFLSLGLHVVAADLDEAGAEALGADLTGGGSGQLLAVRCDVSKEEDVVAAFAKATTSGLGGVDVLVNCAGIGFAGQLSNGVTADWAAMLNVNVLGLSICTREALKSMRERGVDDGHIVHIASKSSHIVDHKYGLCFYAATKWAVRALTEGLRQELAAEKSGIRVTQICPDDVRTNFQAAMYKDWEKGQRFFDENPHLFPEDVVAAVEFALTAPKHVQVQDVLFFPINFPASPQ